MVATAEPPWATALRTLDKPHSLISIAREGRLVRETAAGALRVHISRVDECVLTLVDVARSKGRHIGILYPAPAGDVSVLLAAQVLLQALVRHVPCPTVGLATADVVAAARAWGELRIAAGPTRMPLSDAFPCLRTEPNGRSPFRRHAFKGLLVGDRCHHDWPVDFVIVDHLAGFVVANSSVPAIHIFADPLDPALEAMFRSGELVWSFAPSELRDDEAEGSDPVQLAPFSVAEERLRVISRGMRANIEVVRHAEAEACIDRVRDDLRTLTDVCGQSPAPVVAKGLRVAWQHFTTLLCLPCKPSSFDRFAGLPPIAARATSTFGPEIAAWARMLQDDIGEFGSVLASDMLELRGVLEDSNLFLLRIAALARSDTETVCVVRNHTAARALMQELAGDPDLESSGALHVRSIRRLNREGSWPRAIVVGLLPRWEWHRVDSGLSPDVTYLVLGASEVRITQSMLVTLDSARARWASAETRGPAFRSLLGIEPPAEELERSPVVLTVAVSDDDVQRDPLAQLEPLGMSTPLVIGDEGVEEVVAEESEEGTWAAAVQAVDVYTDRGRIVLPAKRSVEVRSDDDILDCCAEDLKPGMCLLVGRREGRLGLLEAMADRLQKTRPDLFAASLLVSDLRSAVQRAFRAANISISEFYERMRLEGFDKTYHTARGYVVDSGPLAPRDRSDLHLLNQVLKLGFSNRRILEVFAGVQRLRNFRRAAGRALAAAARESTVNTTDCRVDNETGLSLADLREAVMEATVVEVRPRPEAVPLGELGRFEVLE